MENDKKLKLGQEVLIFRNQDINVLEPYIKGIVVNYQRRNNILINNRYWNLDVYTVLGEDKKEYIGSYPASEVMGIYFQTRKEYIDYLKSIRKDTNEVNKIIETIKAERKKEQEEKRRVKREICRINGHDYGDWKEITKEEYTLVKSLDPNACPENNWIVKSSWERKCKCCGNKQTSKTKPLEVLYKEIEDISKGKRRY